MECSGVIRLGDFKTSIELLILDCRPDGTTPIVDITNASDLTIRFKHEDGSEEDKPAVIFTGGTNGNGTDGIVQYVTEVDFITEVQDLEDGVGTLQAIAIATFPDGSVNHSSPGKFSIKSNF